MQAVVDPIANCDPRDVSVRADDAIVVWATSIAGNQTAIHRILSRLDRSGAEVFYQARALIHGSGPASRDETCEMSSRLTPANFPPPPWRAPPRGAPC